MGVREVELKEKGWFEAFGDVNVLTSRPVGDELPAARLEMLAGQ